MSTPTPEQLAAAIKRSYKRLEFSSNDIRCKQETDNLIDQLAALVPAPVERTGNDYETIRATWGGSVKHRCRGCDQMFHSEHGAKFHQCSAAAVPQSWLEVK